MSSDCPPSSNLSPSRLERFNHICRRFEANWRAGSRPRITEFMGDVPEPDRTVVLRELIALELRFRQELGERPTPEDYQGEFPGRTDLIDSVFDSLTATGIKADGVPAISRDGVDTAPVDPDATLTYSVGREGGRVEPLIDADQRQQLRDAFATGGVVRTVIELTVSLAAGAWVSSGSGATCDSTGQWRSRSASCSGGRATRP